MVEIDDIDSREALETWLKDKPRDWSVAIAARAAMRVMPMWWDWTLKSTAARERGFTALPVLQTLNTTLLAASSPSEDVQAFDEKTIGISAALARTFAARARAAAVDAVVSATITANSSTIGKIGAAADCARAAYDVAGFESWKAVGQDCFTLTTDRNVMRRSLWGESRNPLADEWEGVKALAPEERWAFWLAWYDAALKGDPLPDALLLEIAKIDAEDWDKGPAHVNPIINEMWRGFAESANTEEEALRAEVDQAARTRGASKSAIASVQRALADNRKSLPPTLDALQEFILLEMKRWQESNELNATMPDECKRQVRVLLTMYEALEGIGAQIPETGVATEEEAEAVIGLGQLYANKVKELPREKAGHIVEGTFVAASAGLLTMIGLSPWASLAVGAITFARPDANQIIGVAKALITRETDTGA